VVRNVGPNAWRPTIGRHRPKPLPFVVWMLWPRWLRALATSTNDRLRILYGSGNSLRAITKCPDLRSIATGSIARSPFTGGAKYVADAGWRLLAAGRDRDHSASRKGRCSRRIPSVDAEGSSGPHSHAHLLGWQQQCRVHQFTTLLSMKISLWFANDVSLLPSEY
jgi:hypothetical protein